MTVNESSTRPANRVDGRLLRAERTRERLVEAYLGLAFELSPRMPTAQEVATRAGYSVRSVFERFPDLNTLQVAAASYAIDRVAALAPPPPLDADRDTRIEHHVEMRAQLCEVWDRLWRSLLVNRGDSDELRQKISRFQELRLSRLEVVFRPELAALPLGQWQTLAVPLKCLLPAGSASNAVSSPFVIATRGPLSFGLASVTLGTKGDIIAGCKSSGN